MGGSSLDSLVQKAARDLVAAHHAIALTGAGISTESGIRDFRGPDGVWTKNPAAERMAYEAYGKFLADPKAYWEERFTGPSLLGNLEDVQPNPGHYALAELETLGVLKCVITQNVDNLHLRAGSRRVLEYHGNAFKLRCMDCNARYGTEEYDIDMLFVQGKLPPRCRQCHGVLKADVVHFQEAIPQDVATESETEARQCDLMLICGTSAVVYPFAELPRIARRRYPRVTIIEVNAEPTPLTTDGISDCLIQGKTGEILPRIMAEVRRLRG